MDIRLPRPVYTVLFIMVLFVLSASQLISQENSENQNIVAFEIQSLLYKNAMIAMALIGKKVDFGWMTVRVR